MFTGIIEEVGAIRGIQAHAKGGRVTVSARGVLDDIKIGDSVAINGVCLTVVEFNSNSLAFDISEETLARTTLGRLRAGNCVNLERALKVGDRLGGHIVQGHVDATGQFISKHPAGDGILMRFNYPAEIGCYICLKGSITVDGISLTVAGLGQGWFEVAIIPHTLKVTNLGALSSGDTVNLEVDILAKYIERLMQAREPEKDRGSLTMEKLKNLGY
jgi:riboflavin synthase